MMVGKGDYQNTQLEFVTMQALLGSSHKRSHRQKTREQKLQEIKASWRKRGQGMKGLVWGGDRYWKVWARQGVGKWKVLTGMINLSKSLWYLTFRPKEGGATNSTREDTLEVKALMIPTLSEKTEVRDPKQQDVNLLRGSLLLWVLQFLCCCHSIILWLQGPHSIPNY